MQVRVAFKPRFTQKVLSPHLSAQAEICKAAVDTEQKVKAAGRLAMDRFRWLVQPARRPSRLVVKRLSVADSTVI
jgi:hypothetical protein